MVLDDPQIQTLLAEPKPVVELAALNPTVAKGRHRESQRSVVGVNGSAFRLIVRQSILDPSDFSVIRAHELPETTGLFRLRRHNGDSHDFPIAWRAARSEAFTSTSPPSATSSPATGRMGTRRRQTPTLI